MILGATIKLKDQFSSPMIRMLKNTREMTGSMVRAQKITYSATKQMIRGMQDTEKATFSTVKQMKILDHIRVRPIISVVDRASSKISNIREKLTSLKTLAAGIVVGAGISKGLEATVGSAAINEMQMVTMSAVLKSQEKARQYMEWATKEAARTPYSDTEMMSTATALAPYAKDFKTFQEYMKTAETLAAINPAEGLEGAAFALKEALSGDFVSLQERFNLPRSVINDLKKGKTTAEEFHQVVRMAAEAQGFTYDLVEKQSRTAIGLWSTIKGNIGTAFMTAGKGILEGLKPQLETAVDWITKHGDIITAKATAIGKTIGGAIKSVSGLFKQYMPTIQTAINSVRPIFDAIANNIQTRMPEIKTALSAVLEWIGPKLTWVGGVLIQLETLWANAWPLISSVIKTAWKVIRPGLDIIFTGVQIVWDIFKKAWPSIQKLMETTWAAIEPIFNLISGALNIVAKGLEHIHKWIGGGKEIRITTTNYMPKGHAAGLPYVPYDNYPALLHKGEMVLTRVEADQYRKGRAARIVHQHNTFHIYGGDKSTKEIAETVCDYLEDLLCETARNMPRTEPAF